MTQAAAHEPAASEGGGAGRVSPTGAQYARAFDRLADDYDRAFTSRPDAAALRGAVWSEAASHIGAGAVVVELGCGTGEDACFLAGRGARVLAVDVSPAMVAKAAAKLAPFGDAARAAVCDAAFADTEIPRLLAGWSVDNGRVRAILSDFGALNCLPTLDPVRRLAEAVVQPGGVILLCLINRTYLRELARGVLRRLRPSGTLVACGGERTPLSYHPPRTLRWPGFELVRLMGLAVVGRSDVHGRWPLNRLGDHYLAVLRRRIQ